MRWDIFCHVIDNYGDVGICWRLAQQLADEFGIVVRLLVDNLNALQKICPAINRNLATQSIQGIQVLHWVKPFPELVPADVVIEAFGCELPASYVSAMAVDTKEKRGKRWINLEYLSAEAWVAGCHKLPSPHPYLPLTKYFFFPGFTEATGGLIREADLLTQRDIQQADRTKSWRELGISEPVTDETVVSLFCYHHAPIRHLLEAWAASASPVRCLLPHGVATEQIAKWTGKSNLAAGESAQRDNLTIQIIPFLSQKNYDRLLWTCDCNFVRGEDSFVRAQWAARPFIWQIYPQQENAHHPKLEAFLDLYSRGLVKDAAHALRSLHQGWNNNAQQLDWDSYWAHCKVLQQHAAVWVEQRAQMPDLASSLVFFCTEQ